MSELSPLTEQEIAEMEQWLERESGPHGDMSAHAAVKFRALIAEVKRLREEKAIRPQRGIPASVSTDIYNLSAPGIAED